MHTNSEDQSGYKMLKELNRNFTRFGRLGTKPIKVVGLVRRAFARVPERTVYQVRFCFLLQAKRGQPTRLAKISLICCFNTSENAPKCTIVSRCS